MARPASYVLSKEADEDIVLIAQASLARWGLVQAEQYVLGLHEAFERLAQFPDLGREANDIQPGYLHLENASHSIFYKKIAQGIWIIRVLHERMDFARRL